MVYQWSKSDIDEFLRVLTANETRDVALTLFSVAELDRKPQPQPVPTGDARIVAFMERLVNDRRFCIVDWQIPPAYGELRWLAARVLACEYAYENIKNPLF